MQYSISRQAAQRNAAAGQLTPTPAVVNHLNNTKQGLSAVTTQATTQAGGVSLAAVSAAASVVASAATTVSAASVSKQAGAMQDSSQSRTSAQTTVSLLTSAALQLQQQQQKSPVQTPVPTSVMSSTAVVSSPRPASQAETITSTASLSSSTGVTSSSAVTKSSSSASTTQTVPNLKLNIKPPVRPQGKPALIPPSKIEVKEEVKPGKPFRRKGSHFDEHVVSVSHGHCSL